VCVPELPLLNGRRQSQTIPSTVHLQMSQDGISHHPMNSQ
jgi:hypothetical protein